MLALQKDSKFFKKYQERKSARQLSLGLLGQFSGSWGTKAGRDLQS